MLAAHRRFRWVIASAIVSGVSLNNNTKCAVPHDTRNERFSTDQSITNWSSTHYSRPARYYEPESAQEVCRILKAAHLRNEKIRPVGTALSPNGIGLSSYGNNALSVSHIDYIEVDTKRELVTVGAGARVSDVLKKLNEHNLTLENFSSIQEQQVAGWTQVSAHGTGCKLSTVDDMIVRMKMATPTEGLLTLSETSNPDLFQMAKVGLGSLGVVTELTLKCVPKFSLKEQTKTVDTKSITGIHKSNLQNFRHVRYMWLPYTSKVVTVVSNPVSAAAAATVTSSTSSSVNSNAPTKPLVELLLQINPAFDRSTAEKLTFSQLRDHLLGHSPLDTAHIKRVNQAEAQFWERMNGERVDDSTNILGFDCGGEQWVYEICLPIGPVNALPAGSSDSKDIQFVRRVLQLIEQHQLPAPCPIEQRWTARSTAPMSPAFSLRPEDVFSWVGVIMYMPPNQNEEQRQAITKQFEHFVALLQPLVKEYDAHCHWAKIELPSKDSSGAAVAASDKSLWSFFGGKTAPETYEQKVSNLQARIAAKYPVKEFNGYRKVLDPKGILSNELIDTLFSEGNK